MFANIIVFCKQICQCVLEVELQVAELKTGRNSRNKQPTLATRVFSRSLDVSSFTSYTHKQTVSCRVQENKQNQK